ncbi:hypothetical protein B0O99DRAFT_607740 [Bisporella sp. PMI_857]|nr:hypothetical protein B0O99DRAFT_607740 [Bisporella sp. PMI_857]
MRFAELALVSTAYTSSVIALVPERVFLEAKSIDEGVRVAVEYDPMHAATPSHFLCQWLVVWCLCIRGLRS